MLTWHNYLFNYIVKLYGYVNNLMNRIDAISRWRIHCSGPDFTGIIFAISKFHDLISTLSCVAVCACREACRFTRISCDVGHISKWHLKGSGRWCTGFLCCVKVLGSLDHLEVLYMASAFIATFNFTGITLKVSVLDIVVHIFYSSSSSFFQFQPQTK